MNFKSIIKINLVIVITIVGILGWNVQSVSAERAGSWGIFNRVFIGNLRSSVVPNTKAHLFINRNNYAAIQLGDDEVGKGFHITKAGDRGNNAFEIWSGKVGGPSIKRFTILQNGNIGIGASNPSARLQVAGNIKATKIQLTGGTPGAGKVLTSDANGSATWQDASSSGEGSFRWAGNNNQNQKISRTGNVGIGAVNNGTGKLFVSGDINISNSGGVYKWKNIAGLTKTCPTGQTLSGITVGGGIITAGGNCVDISGGSGDSGGVSGSGTTNRIPLWTGSTNLGNSIISQSGSNINVAGNLDLSVSEGTSLINRSRGALSIRAQSTGNTPGLIDFKTDGTTRMTIHEPNFNNPSLNGTVDIPANKLLVRGAGSAGKVLTSVNGAGLVGWQDLPEVPQGTMCGFSTATATGSYGNILRGAPVNDGIRDLCQGFDPAVSCPSGYKGRDTNTLNFAWTQQWTCVKN